jgi:hypothetical protein
MFKCLYFQIYQYIDFYKPSVEVFYRSMVVTTSFFGWEPTVLTVNCQADGCFENIDITK